MKKIIDTIKIAAQSALAWMRSDGIIHNLMCYSILLTLAPIIGAEWARGVTVACAFGKEAFDVFVQKDNDWREALHDLACDAMGMMEAELTLAIWPIC